MPYDSIYLRDGVLKILAYECKPSLKGYVNDTVSLTECKTCGIIFFTQLNVKLNTYKGQYEKDLMKKTEDFI